jgi:3-hydroxymyristoyl/3-hydroxydecanoyl-(acyl carrier protein) dehydratase
LAGGDLSGSGAAPEPGALSTLVYGQGQAGADASAEIISLTREQCLEFAVGSVGKALGPRFSEVDSFPSRVRLPAEPMMFVDRVIRMEGRPLSLSSGRAVTERDVRPEEWCLEGGRLTPGMSIESGQADMLLSSYLGVDFATQGLANYRLLDAQVVFHRDPPKVGETASYDIRLINFFSHADTRMFRFEFDGSLGGVPMLSMRRGCAGFFTTKALAAGKGLARETPDPAGNSSSVDPNLVSQLTSLEAERLSPEALSALRKGDLGALGASFGKLKLDGSPLTLPGGKLALIDQVAAIVPGGGVYGAGLVRAEAAIDKSAWFLKCHFPGDEVMPGTLMYDACLQTLRVYLLALGWIGPAQGCAFLPALGVAQSLRCRGQVTPATKMVAYEAHVKTVGLSAPSEGADSGEPYAVADALMWADGRPIVEVINLGLRLKGLSLDALSSLWAAKKQRGRPKGSTKKIEAPAPEAPAAGTVVRRKTRQPEAAPPPGSVNVQKLAKVREVFDKSMLVEMSTGRLSSVLGPDYARFDDGQFVARLPQEPYDLIDQAVIRKGRPGQVSPGTQVEALCDPSMPGRSWLTAEAGGASPVLPYAALNEMALQPCGFLAAYMGSALAFQGPMHFRNLGGEAVLKAWPAADQPIQTRASLTKASVLGAMTIQHYQFSCQCGGQTIYEGQTHFGFHNPESLERQAGLKAPPALLKALTSAAAAGPPLAYPQGPAWPSGRWLMLDSVVLDTRGDGRAWGRVKVDPKAWFFAAHFPGDPVWPGSLGLEAFIELAKVLAAKMFEPRASLAELKASWRAPSQESAHRWLYRGQITPKNKEVSLGIKVTAWDPHRRVLTYKGLLWVDDLVIYQVENFSIKMERPSNNEPETDQ